MSNDTVNRLPGIAMDVQSSFVFVLAIVGARFVRQGGKALDVGLGI